LQKKKAPKHYLRANRGEGYLRPSGWLFLAGTNGRVGNPVQVPTKDLSLGALQLNDGTFFSEVTLFEEGGGPLFGLEIQSASGVAGPEIGGFKIGPGLFVPDEDSFHDRLEYRKKASNS
jgi:hypothetical protein